MMIKSAPFSATGPVRLGVMFAQNGPAGLWGPSVIASARLAVTELNAAGGIWGRDVALSLIDCPNGRRQLQHETKKYIDNQRIDGLVGMFPSSARAAVTRQVAGKIPFIYTPAYEGGENPRHVIATGESTADLVDAALDWAFTRRKCRRVFFCGSDYRWPRESFARSASVVARHGGEVVGQRLHPLGDSDFAPLIEQIAHSGADCVVPLFLGMEAVHFNRAFAQAGLQANIWRCAAAMDETILYALTEDETENLILSSGYFTAHDTQSNACYLDRYYAAHGRHAPPPNSYGQSVYEGVHNFASLAKAAGSLNPRALGAMLGQVAAGASARVADKNCPIGAPQTVLVAEALGYEVKVVATRAPKYN